MSYAVRFIDDIPCERRPRQEEVSVMLDRFVFRRDGGVKRLPENKTMAGSSTCTGAPFRVSLGLFAPPSTSRFYLEWPGGPNEDTGIPCHLVAAHRNCVLFRLTSIVRSKTRPQYLIYPDDYYLYRPATADLKRLPTCTRTKPVAAEGEQKQDKLGLMSKSEPSDSEPWEWDSSESDSGEIVMTEEMKWAEKASREHYEEKLAMGVDVDHDVVRSSLVMERIGLLCQESSEGGDEFVVTELQLVTLNRKVSAELSLLRSSASDWVHMPLPIHCNNKRDSAALRHFCIQAVVPLSDCLCWVDYCSGIIIAKNVLDKTPSLSYIPLPHTPPSGCEHQLRSVCATVGGHLLKFIDTVVDQQPCSSGFTIISYILIATEEGSMEWKKETSMTSDEMWGLKAPGRVPHEVPMFPLVNLENPDIIHFQLSECTDYVDTVTLLTIDMSARSVVSVFTHIKGEQELRGEDADVAEARTGLLQPFLLAMVPKFLLVRPVNLRKRKDQS
ncbi:hypothetical protein EJB05_47674 [Eragrostis curvula]|uniref:DUF1618 domain-containing protein n=1 Tax=Eragrostis curvula TaxID=38414 RepID=A0A5J9SZN8_9POAL|nr:hypothetical protein EJB05_47674 [Eragrostis curvula]